MTNIAVGDVINSTVVVGNDNFVIHLDKVEQGATVNIVKPDNRPKYSVQPPPVLKLPRPFPILPGRDKEVAILRADCEVGANVSVWGRKGIGKTALARHMTNVLSKEDASKSIVYLDALGLGREDLLQAMFDLFYDSLPSYVPSPVSIPNALQKVKALVFVDNLSLSGDELESLLNAAPGCAFVLISTQRALEGEGEVLALQGLPDTEAVGLFEKEFGRPLNDAEKEACRKICELLKGCPDDVIRMADRGRAGQESPTQLLVELASGPVDDKSLASVAVASLNAADQKVLAFLAAAGENTVPIEVLKSVFQDMDVSAELERLKSLHLVQSHSPRFSLCGTLPYGLAAAWDITASRDLLLDTSISWLSQQPASETVHESLGMLLHSLSDAADRKKWREVIRLGRLLELFLIRFKRWQAWYEVLNLILRAAQALGERATEGWALHQLGSRALVQGTFQHAHTYLNQALDIRKALKDRAGMDVTRHNLDLLKGVAPNLHGNGSIKGGGGGHALRYGFFGFAGLVLVAAVAYAMSQGGTSPAPPAPPVPTAAPVLSSTSTSAPISPSQAPSIPETATFTLTPESIPTDTPTWTPTPTAAVIANAPFNAIVEPDFLACRYGPGAAYLYYYTLEKGYEVEVRARADTAFGPWVYVKYSKAPRPCWVNPKFLDLQGGDISGFPQPFYPDSAPLILFDTSPWPADRFPPPTDVSADRYGNLVGISWTGKVVALGDRESETSPRFLVEAWTCIGGQIVFSPIGAGADLKAPDGSLTQVDTQVQDDAGCSEPSHAQVFLAHKDGYVGPVAVPWPP